MKRKAFFVILCVLPIWASSQTILRATDEMVQVLDSIVARNHDESNWKKIEYKYDNKANTILETYYHWDSNINKWLVNKKYECQYNVNNLSWFSYYWNSVTDMWERNRKYECQYDDDDNSTCHSFYWDTTLNLWVEDEQHEDKYPNDDEYQDEYPQDEYPQDEYPNEYQYPFEYQYAYDVNNNLKSVIINGWNGITNTWEEYRKSEYQYDGNNNLTLETYYLKEVGNAWTKISTSQYYNSPLTVNSITQVEEQFVTVFPNPARDCIIVRGIAESTITVFNLSGGIIYKQVMKGKSKTIDVSSWINGTYLIFVEAGNNRTVSKIIKK